MNRPRLNIPFKCGTPQYQRATRACRQQGCKYDDLDDAMKKTIGETVEQSKTNVDKVTKLVEALDEVGWQMANINASIKKLNETIAGLKEVMNGSKAQ